MNHTLLQPKGIRQIADSPAELVSKNEQPTKLRNLSLCDLFPYNAFRKTGANLKIGLKEYEMILNLVAGALNAISVGDLSKFDPLVGENACEIRAARISIIFSKKLVDVPYLLKKLMR
jgi:hypothetical protein